MSAADTDHTTVYRLVTLTDGWQLDRPDLPAGSVSARDGWHRWKRAYFSSRLSVRVYYTSEPLSLVRSYDHHDGDYHHGFPMLAPAVGTASRSSLDRLNGAAPLTLRRVLWDKARFIPHDHADAVFDGCVYALALLTAQNRKAEAAAERARLRATLGDAVPTELLAQRVHRMAPLPGAGLVSWHQPHGSVELVAAILAQLSILYPYAALSDGQLAWAGTLAGLLQTDAHERGGHRHRPEPSPLVGALGMTWAQWAERIADFPLVGWVAVDKYRRQLAAIDGFARHYG